MLWSGTALVDPFKVLERIGICLGWHVADLGCGSLGHFVFPAAQFVGHEGMVYAVDIQKTALSAIQSRAHVHAFTNIRTVWSDVEVPQAVRMASESMDLTLITNVFSLCRDRSGLLQEAARLTKPGGKIVVIDWKKGRGLFGPLEIHRVDSKDIAAYFTDSLVQTDAFDAGDYHYALVYQKDSHERLDDSLQTASRSVGC